jgi:hypothetical protein
LYVLDFSQQIVYEIMKAGRKPAFLFCSCSSHLISPLIYSKSHPSSDSIDVAITDWAESSDSGATAITDWAESSDSGDSAMSEWVESSDPVNFSTSKPI